MYKKINHFKNVMDNGFTIIPNVLNNQECENLKKIAKKTYKKYKKKVKIKNPLEQTIYNLHNKNSLFIKYLKFEKIHNLVFKLLSTGSFNNSSDIIIRQMAIRNPLKGHAQQLHNDTRITGCYFPLVIHVIYMLDDFTKSNGATRVVPKSHRSKLYAQNKKKYKNEKLLLGKRGDAIVFNAALWHGSAKKINNVERWGMIYSYSRWFLKPDFDYNRNMPLKLFKKLNSEQKKLFGYNVNPPKDEFSRSSTRANKAEKPSNYKLPN